MGAAFGLRSKPGEITKGDVITVLPFGNYIVTKQVAGAELKQLLENGAKSYPDTLGAFAHVSGIEYKIDAAKPEGQRVHGIMVKGQAIDMEATYLLATNDFIAAGGDEYTLLVDKPIVNEFPALDEALIAYIQQMGEVDVQVEGRIEVAVMQEEPVITPEQQGKVYIVQPGDTLYLIAREHGTVWQRLQEINQLMNPHLIFPGQRIELPSN